MFGSNKKGIAFIFFVIWIPVILAFIVFAVDVSVLLHEEHRLQVVCRQAAYSGAVKMIETNDDQAARRRAREIFRNQMGQNQNPTISINSNNIEVEATKDIPLFFKPIWKQFLGDASPDDKVEITRSFTARF